MDRLKMHSVNKVEENIKKIVELFPNALTEDIRGYREDGSAIINYAIDFDILRQELSDILVDGSEERYQFTWPDKKKSILLANAPIAKTLRPCRDESVNFEETENLYIEGDNLEVLKLLQETYLGKVKMIYIDPPYNTGNDFVYEDDFAQNTEDYLANSGQFDEYGNRLVQNTESNGRFHTDWLNMIYPRLKLAKDLLHDHGVIFISIDDNEVHNLRKICDEIFGADNFISDIIWEKRYGRSNDAKLMSSVMEHLLLYRKSNNVFYLREPRSEENNKDYSNPDNDPRGPWTSVSFVSQRTKVERPNLAYTITNPFTGKEFSHPTNSWKYNKEKYEEMLSDNRFYWGRNKDQDFPRIKRFLSELSEGMVPVNLWKHSDTGTTDQGTKEVSNLIGKNIFTYPKPISYIQRMLKMGCGKNDIVVDFFSGSASTAHAVMQLNAEDGGTRKYIMVQLPEKIDEKSDAIKKGFIKISDIGKERIRRAGKKILEEKPEVEDKLDIGFRVLKVDSTNMRDVYYNPAEYSQGLLSEIEDNIKPDRTPEDLLFQVMLNLGVLLSSKIEETIIEGKKVFNVADGYLIACFDDNVTSEVITKVAKIQPYYAVFRDSSLANDSVVTNFEQIFETYSPTTVRKVL